jgi:hypothetical protein
MSSPHGDITWQCQDNTLHIEFTTRLSFGADVAFILVVAIKAIALAEISLYLGLTLLEVNDISGLCKPM